MILLYLEVIILALALVFAAVILAEDLKSMEVSERYLLAFGLCGAAYAVACPLPGLTTVDCLVGGLAAWGVTLFVRIWMRIRVGGEALGLADVLLAVGGGLFLGPAATGLWILAFCAIGAIGGVIAPALLGARSIVVEEKNVLALPLCPPMLATGGILFALMRSGVLDARNPAGIAGIF
jgi:prepilin signal peptidase PulO-like enzyme (type II secretory pathway)